MGCRVTTNGDGVSFQGDKNVVLDNGGGVQVCENTKTHRIVCCKMWILWYMNYILRQLLLKNGGIL